MLSNLIKIGDRLEISFKKDNNRGKTFVSQVEKFIDEEHLILHVPISYGQVIKLPIGEHYFFLFFTEKGMIRFDAAVLELFKEDGFHLMKIKLTTPGEKMQRREFFRFTCLLPLKFSAISENPSDTTDSGMQEGIIKDVGGGGIRFVANELLEEGQKIKCLILLNEDYYIIIAKVLHRQHFPKAIYKFQYRAVFIGILPDEQERIVQFIFTEQRKNLQKSNF